MKNNPYAPPSAELAGTTHAKGAAPRSVVLAARLLWLGFSVSLVGLVISIFRSPIAGVISFGFVFQLALQALQAYVIVCISHGKNWARVFSLIITLLSLPSFVVFLYLPEATASVWLQSAVTVALNVVAMYLVFSKPGSSWFINDQSESTSPEGEAGDATGGVIPYKNPDALTAYYLGLFSIIPVIGFFLGAAALNLGISGLKKRKQTPIIRGSAHAWIGIIGGGFSVLVHLLVIGVIFFGVTRR